MRISIGDVSTQTKDIDQAKEIIREYEVTIMAENRLVSHYLVDGMEIADIDAYLEGKDSQEIQNVVLVTRTPQELVRESVITFLDYIPALQNGLLTVKEKLTIGETIPVDSWLPLIDGLEWTNQLLQGLSGLIERDRDKLEEIATNWQEQLTEMLSAWENGDFVLLADIIEYEILEVLEELETYFNNYLS